MKIYSRNNEVVFPVEAVEIEKDQGFFSGLKISIAGGGMGSFEYEFKNRKELELIAQVLVGDLSPHKALGKFSDYWAGDGQDYKSHPLVRLLFFAFSNSKKSTAFVQGSFAEEVRNCKDNFKCEPCRFRL